MKECRWCKHLEKEEDGNFGESRYFWYECNKTGYHNLNGFPFKNTKCKYYEKSKHYIKRSMNWDGLNLIKDKK